MFRVLASTNPSSLLTRNYDFEQVQIALRLFTIIAWRRTNNGADTSHEFATERVVSLQKHLSQLQHKNTPITKGSPQGG